MNSGLNLFSINKLIDLYSKCFLFLKVIFRYLKNVFFLCSTIMEMAVTFERLILIQSTTKTLVTRKDKIIVSMCIFLSFFIFVPVLFAETIESKENGHFILKQTELTKKKMYTIYLTCVSFIPNILTVVVIIPFNLIVLFKYRKFIKKKNSISITRIVLAVLPRNLPNTSEIIDSQKRFTRMILIVSFLFILSRLSEASIRVTDLLYTYFKPYSLYSVYFTILNIFVEIIACIIFSLNFFIYYSFNKPFRDSFNKKFLCRKIL